MDLEFRRPDGSQSVFRFTRLPLGLNFRRGSPLVVDNVEPDSHAEELGVASAYVVVACNGELLSATCKTHWTRTLSTASCRLPQLRHVTKSQAADVCAGGGYSSWSVRDRLLSTVETRATSPCDEFVALTEDRTLVYRCPLNAGLFNCVLMFLRFAESAEAKGFTSALLDASALPLYGDVSALFPAFPQSLSKQLEHVARGFLSKGAFANTRGAVERRGPLTEADVKAGRSLASKHLRLRSEVELLLQEAAALLNVCEALGVHLRRTDKGREAPSNLSISAAEVASRVCQEARALGVKRVFVASDDTPFQVDVERLVEAAGIQPLHWGSRMSAKLGKASHYDCTIAGLEKAADAIADCYLLSRCKGILSTYSSLSVTATLWAKPGTPWMYFHQSSEGVSANLQEEDLTLHTSSDGMVECQSDEQEFLSDPDRLVAMRINCHLKGRPWKPINQFEFVQCFDWWIGHYQHAGNFDQNAATVFCLPNKLPVLLEYIKAASWRLQSDEPVRRTLMIGGDDHHLSKVLGDVEPFRAWFAAIFYEAKDISHAFIRPIPAGLCEHYYRGHEGAMVDAMLRASCEAKTELVMAAWGKFWKELDSTPYRRRLANFCEASSFVRRHDVPFQEWFATVSRHRFLLCPGGRGVQEPKVQEALLVLTIPVVVRGPAYEDLERDGFPLLMVDAWEEVTESKLLAAWETMHRRLERFRATRLSGRGCAAFYMGKEPLQARRPITLRR